MSTAVREKQILFSDEMVRAIRDNRKSMTRRLIKWKPIEEGLNLSFSGLELGHYFTDVPTHGWVLRSRNGSGCWNDRTHPVKPRYQVSDRVWIREGVILLGHERRYRWPHFDDPDEGKRWFDRSCLYTADLDHDDAVWEEPHGRLNKLWMPRWAAREWIEITESDRAERIQQITHEDSKREGVWPCPHRCPGGNGDDCYRCAFKLSWTRMHGPKGNGWDANPAVWVYGFKRIKP